MELFKGINPNPPRLWSINGRIGYGCVSSKRKYGRYIRKYGFDITEVWNLDCTIACWLSDNVKGFFRECGDIVSWSCYDLEGNILDFDSNYKDVIKAEQLRREEFQKQLKQFLLNANDEWYNKFSSYVIPRINFLSSTCHGYPSELESYEKWQEILRTMVINLEQKDVDLLIKHFFSLWD
jgi:hypothetical protein